MQNEELHATKIYTIKDKNGDTCFTYKVKQMSAGYTDRITYSTDEMKVVYVRSGSAVWNVNGKRLKVCKDDILLYNRLDLRFITEITSSEAFVIEQLCFYPVCFGNFKICDFYFLRTPEFSNLLAHDDAEPSEIRTLYHRIRDELSSDSPFRDDMVLAILTELMVSISRKFDRRDITLCSRTATSKNQIKAATEYICEHFREELTLDSLARMFAMSPSHFSRCFRQCVGIGLHEYIRRCRISEVITLIRQRRDINIFDAALLCGFNTSSGFYKAFKSVIGTNPGAFIKTVYDN